MKVLLYISIIGVLFFGCKKEHRYEEDPKNSKATPQERLNGNWKITSYTFNGNSIYDQLNQKAIGSKFNLDNVLFGYLHKTKNSEYYSDGDAFEVSPFPGSTQHRNFDDYTYLQIRNTGGQDALDSLYAYWFISPKKYHCGSVAYWKVTKLYENDFHIVLKTDSGNFKMTLIKTKI
ncbi:MAG: hypothetical protein IPG89_01015 [Bacteroidetes bacterium]|nr:hypothetical protein [Bacteroidota bacterium]